MNIQLIESKQDKQNFIDKFGQDTYDLFIRSKDRLKNNNLSTDIVWHTKHTSVNEMENMLARLQQKMGNQDLSNTDFEEEQIPGKYKYLGMEGGYKIYQPLDYVSSMALGVNTGWCTTGRYGHYGEPNFQPDAYHARTHFDNYTSRGIKFYYLINPKTRYGEMAVAVYPNQMVVNRYIKTNHGLQFVKSVNCEIFNAQDYSDYNLLAKLPDKVRNLLNVDYQDLDASSEIKKDELRRITLMSEMEAIRCSGKDFMRADYRLLDNDANIPGELQRSAGQWWIKSELHRNSDGDTYAKIVGDNGIYQEALRNVQEFSGVRPIIKVSNMPKEVKVGELVKCLDNFWFYIGGNTILSAYPIAVKKFNETPYCASYESSSVRKFLGEWVQQRLSKEESLNEDIEEQDEMVTTGRRMSDGPLPTSQNESLKGKTKMNLKEFREKRRARLKKLNESIINLGKPEALDNLPELTDGKAHIEVDAVLADAINTSLEREKQTKDALKDKNKEAKEFIKEQDQDVEAEKEDKAENHLMLDESLFMEDYQMLSSIELTDEGLEKVNQFIAELEAKRKEILDAGKDTADDTEIPTVADIVDDITWEGVDDDGEYYNGWAVTDNYDSDSPLLLKLGVDFVDTYNESLIDDHREMLNKKKEKDAVRRSNEIKKKEDKKPLKEKEEEEPERMERMKKEASSHIAVADNKNKKVVKVKKSDAKLNEASQQVEVLYTYYDGDADVRQFNSLEEAQEFIESAKEEAQNGKTYGGYFEMREPIGKDTYRVLDFANMTHTGAGGYYESLNKK